MRHDKARELPLIEELRGILIPTDETQQWDHGELPQAVLNLDSQVVLSRCEALLRLAVVERRSLDDTTTARVVALQEVLRELLPTDLDHPSCSMLRALAGLARGTAGRRRGQRQEAAGRVLGEGTYVVNPRSVRRRARQDAWPWLLDRLIEQEVQARKAIEAEAALLPAFQEGTLDNDMNRREFLLGIPAAWLLSRSRLIQLPGYRSEAATLNATTLDELTVAIASDKRLCNQLGGRAVYGLVTEHARLATELLRGSPPEALRPRLAAIASEAAAEAGFVYSDQGQFSAAASYYQLAAELAHEARDPLLEVFVLGNWSDRLGEAGGADRALLMLDHAGKLILSRASPATLAHLALIEAETRASLGHTDASLRALDRADSALERGDRSEDPPFLYWLDDGVRARWKGRCLTRLGRLEDADALLAQALSAWDPSFVRDRAITFVDLAHLRLRQQEPDECCRLAGQALELAVATGSPKNVQRIRTLRLELQPWQESPAVKSLDERMVAVSSV
jgi:tetratricopeptide (TPR) repeat protein